MQKFVAYLTRDIATLKSVGQKYAPHMKRLSITQLSHALFHYPHDIIDRRLSSKINDGKIVTLIVKIQEHIDKDPRKHSPYKIRCTYNLGTGIRWIDLVYFKGNSKYLYITYPSGSEIIVSGQATFAFDMLQMVHPIIERISKKDYFCILEPQYGLTYGLTTRHMHSIANEIIHGLKAQSIPELLPQSIIHTHDFVSWFNSIERVHNPNSIDDLQIDSKFRLRLAMDELLTQQISMRLVRNIETTPKKEVYNFSGSFVKQFLQKLPFELTSDQLNAIVDISKDQAGKARMARLLQGDVGSGKTIVALCAILNAVEAGKQGVLMVPTELLARQHFATISQYLASFELNVVVLLGTEAKKERVKIEDDIASGRANIVIGTHALFQERTAFSALGVVVIDEQHRCGVNQRISLVEKGYDVDLLMMSATPIPRTLNMILYGDLDISIMRNKPQGRKKIITTKCSADKIDDLIIKVEAKIAQGHKIYWICPLVKESEKLKLQDVESRYLFLQKHFGPNVSMVHGKMSSSEKDKAMNDFAYGSVGILIATTVIEVGINVPAATIIIIEHAERFGLSQLHQLRGRVGRSDEQSYCVLLYHNHISREGKLRLDVLCKSDDGFEIARKDLEIRGAGDFIGTKQSGIPSFHSYNLFEHGMILDKVAKLAIDYADNLNEATNAWLNIYGYDLAHICSSRACI